MAIISTDKGDFSMDGWLYEQCLAIKELITTSDNFKVLLIDGKERSGKSVLAQQIAKTIDSSFNEERMCMNAEQFHFQMVHAERGQAVVYDEGYTGLGAEKARQKVTNMLREKLMGVGQKNICIIIVIQKIWKLERYAALEVSDDSGLIHVYTKSEGGKIKKGYWAFFSSSQKELIYDLGKKKGGRWAYNAMKVGSSRRRGRFYNKYVIDEKAYRERKMQSFNDDGDETRSNNKFKGQRDVFLRLLHQKSGLTLEELSDLCKEQGFPIGKSQIANIINEKKKDYG